MHNFSYLGTLRQQYLSCYLPNFDQTSNVGSLEHLEQNPTATVTFLKATFFLAILVHIGNISAATESI